MNTEAIYQHYNIPLNLQQHMLRVAALGKIICTHFPPHTIDTGTVVQTLLLHDMGNIVKFDLTNPALLLDEDKNRIEELLEIQQYFCLQYGKTASEATESIMKELRCSQACRELFLTSQGEYMHLYVDEPVWEKKVAYYCDMRVGPFGIISLKERFGDLVTRYPHTTEDFLEFLRIAESIEEQIQRQCTISLDSIDNTEAEEEFAELLAIEF